MQVLDLLFTELKKHIPKSEEQGILIRSKANIQARYAARKQWAVSMTYTRDPGYSLELSFLIQKLVARGRVQETLCFE